LIRSIIIEAAPVPSSPLRKVQGSLFVLSLLAGWGWLSEPVPAAGPDGPPCCDDCCITSLDQLKCLSLEDLDRLFHCADAHSRPVGFARGCILVTAAAHPKLRKCVAAATWQGKDFAEDGRFINQWRGVRAIHSQAVCGTSWWDGKPCLILEYPPGTPLFANIHEEVREVGPGLYLVRAYERCPCPKFLEYIGLELQPCKDPPRH
jgi:hypothetical protein